MGCDSYLNHCITVTHDGKITEIPKWFDRTYTISENKFRCISREDRHYCMDRGKHCPCKTRKQKTVIIYDTATGWSDPDKYSEYIRSFEDLQPHIEQIELLAYYEKRE
jgi:hypothetical protein